jgi:hypothetical protein
LSPFADARDLEEELLAFLAAFLGSDDGRRACDAARALGDRARLVLRTVEPEAVISVDFFAAAAQPGSIEDPNVELEIEAAALHDLLLGRLDPVQISRLYETDRLVFAGGATDLAALVALAGALQPHYPASLERRGRTDLLETPEPERHAVWSSEPGEPAPQVIGARRPWQRPRRSAAAR